MIDFSTDYLFWDNVEAVTVTTSIGGSATSTSVARALRQDISRKRGQYAGIQLQGDEVGWLVPVALMGGVEINSEDRIVGADSSAWRIVGAVKRCIGSNATHWELATRRES